VPPPGQQVLMLTVLLDRAGLALGRDVEGVPLAYADHPAALERGDVDAYIGTEPLCTQSVVAGIGSRLTTIFDTPIGDFNTALWASPSMLRDPEMCRLGASMQKQAAEYLSPGGVNDRAAWRDLLVEQFGYEQAIYDAVLENVGAEWRFDAERVSQVEEFATYTDHLLALRDWLSAHGVTRVGMEATGCSGSRCSGSSKTTSSVGCSTPGTCATSRAARPMSPMLNGSLDWSSTAWSARASCPPSRFVTCVT